MERKVLHFSPGPSKLPREVLLQAQKEFVEYGDTGISVTEMSHRSPDFHKILSDAENLLRELMGIPNNYTVMFLQGGATGQFAGIPLNLIGLKAGHEADYVVTGAWSSKAAAEAEKYGTVNRVLPKTADYTGIPDESTWKLSPSASYVHYCANETIHGIEFGYVPETHGVPLVCDMSSNILTCRVDVSKFGLIYAGAQKNLGMAGVAVVIVRDELIGHSLPTCPIVWDYSVQKKSTSNYNTPPTYGIYMMSRVLGWVKGQGGADEMQRLSGEKSRLVYDAIEASDGFYRCEIDQSCRSRVNVTFRVGGSNGDVVLEKRFVDEGLHDWNMTSLAGHRSVGGIRVSLYNAVTRDETVTFVSFMEKFRRENGPPS